MTLKERFPKIKCLKILKSIQLAEFPEDFNDGIQKYIDSSRFLIDSDFCVDTIIEGIRTNLGLEDFLLSFKKGENGKISITIEKIV